MNKVLIKTFPFTIASGQSTEEIRFTPQAGRVLGICVYDNLTPTLNTGLVRAKLATDTGDEVVGMVNIKHLQSRQAASYNESFMPLQLDTDNQAFVFTIAATSAFTADYKGDLTLIYEKNDLC